MSTRRATAAVLVFAAFAATTGCGKDPSGGDVAKSGSAAKTTGWNGRFRAKTDAGTVTLTLEDLGDGSVRVTSPGGSAVGRVTAPGRVEGRESAEDGGGAFVLDLDGDRLTMRGTMQRPDGTSVEIPEIRFDRAQPAATGGARDGALVGHWRHTSAHSSSGFSQATDTHLILEEDGTYATWTKTAGDAGNNESARTTGVWKTDAKVLYLRPEGEAEWQQNGAYSLSDTHLLLTYGPRNKQIFERL